MSAHFDPGTIYIPSACFALNSVVSILYWYKASELLLSPPRKTMSIKRRDNMLSMKGAKAQANLVTLPMMVRLKEMNEKMKSKEHNRGIEIAAVQQTR